ncbi:MAG TPA: hypothetical protein VFL82_08275, partial [Thermomicrobiales bacterium]|nr:hypothetical protein [Thermomicrobiales bacterium]
MVTVQGSGQITRTRPAVLERSAVSEGEGLGRLILLHLAPAAIFTIIVVAAAAILSARDIDP